MARFALLLLSLVLILNNHVEGQPLFHRGYSDVEPTQLISTRDGGCLVAGIYRKEVEENFGLPVLLKLSSLGTIEWKMLYTAEDKIVVTRAIQTTNGEYVVGGYWYNPENSSSVEAFLMRISTDGNTLWVKTFTDSTLNKEMRQSNGVLDIQETPEGELIVLSSSFAHSSLNLSRHSSAGELLRQLNLAPDLTRLPRVFPDACNVREDAPSDIGYFFTGGNIALTKDGSIALHTSVSGHPYTFFSGSIVAVLSPDWELQWGELVHTWAYPAMRITEEDQIVVTFSTTTYPLGCGGYIPSSECYHKLRESLPESFDSSWITLYSLKGERLWSKSFYSDAHILDIFPASIEQSGDFVLALIDKSETEKEVILARLNADETILSAAILPDTVLENAWERYRDAWRLDLEEEERDREMTEEERMNGYYIWQEIEYASTFDNGLLLATTLKHYHSQDIHLFRLNPSFSYGCQQSSFAEIDMKDVDVPYQSFRLVPTDARLREAVPPEVLAIPAQLTAWTICTGSETNMPGSLINFHNTDPQLVVKLFPNSARVSTSIEVQFRMPYSTTTTDLSISLIQPSSAQQLRQIPLNAVRFNPSDGTGSAMLNTTGLNPGIYLVEVRSGEVKGTAKLHLY